MSRKALGKGLGSLIPQSDSPGGLSRPIPIDQIDRNPKQPRKSFDDAALEGLSDSIKEHGVLEPIIIRPVGKRYEIVVGERRWRASKRAGLKTIPSIIRTLSDVEALELALVENIQREDLNPIEEAETYKRLMDELGMTQGEIADRVGKSRSTVANSIRILDIDPELRVDIAQGLLSAGHAKALLSIESKQKRLEVAKRIIEEGLSVRAVEEIAANIGAAQSDTRPQPKTAKASDPIINDLVDRLQHSLGTKVRIVHRGGKGRIEINYYSHDEMERLLDLLGGTSDSSSL